MSLFDTPNSDAYTIALEQGARGPQLGFQDAFMAALDAQAKVHSLLGVQQSFRDVEQRQIKKLRERGIEPPPSLDESEMRGSGPFGGAQFLQGRYSAAAQGFADGSGAYTDALIEERDTRLKKLQQEHPDLGLQTYAEMFKGVQEQGQEALHREALPKTFGGEVGAFVGGTVGGLNPVNNPLNLAGFIVTAPLGGPTVVARTAAQGAAQGVTEALGIALGPDNKGIVTGQPTTPREAAAQIGLATAGGVGGQLFAEGVGMGVRKLATGKWFADLPPDKLPTRETPPSRPMDETTPHAERMEPDRPLTDYENFEAFAKSQGYDLGNPYGASRQAYSRHVADVDYAARELNRWDGPAAHEIAARTDTALPPDAQPGVRYDGAYQRYVDRLENVDDIARRLDGDLFTLYDKLEQQRAEVRASIERTNTLPDLRPEAHRPDVQADFAAWKAKTDQELRLELQQIDYKMRDMAPLVSRAYAAAEREWRATPVDFATLDFLKQLEQRSGWRYRGEGEPSLTEKPMAPKAGPPPLAPPADALPLTMMTPAQQAKLRPGQHDAADRVAIVVRDTIETAEKNVDAFMADVRKAATMDAAELKAAQKAAREKLEAAQTAERMSDTTSGRDAANNAVKKAQKELDALTGITLPDGQRLDFDVPMIGRDGEKTTVRDYLAEMDKDSQALQAVRTCSLPS